MEDSVKSPRIAADTSVSKLELYQTIDSLCDLVIWMSSGFLRVDISDEDKAVAQEQWVKLRDTVLNPALKLFV